LAQPSYPGHSTILLRSESPSGMCAKLRTVAATSNNRVYLTRSLYYCLFAPLIYGVVLRAHSILFMVNHTPNPIRSPNRNPNPNLMLMLT